MTSPNPCQKHQNIVDEDHHTSSKSSKCWLPTRMGRPSQGRRTSFLLLLPRAIMSVVISRSRYCSFFVSSFTFMEWDVGSYLIEGVQGKRGRPWSSMVEDISEGLACSDLRRKLKAGSTSLQSRKGAIDTLLIELTVACFNNGARLREASLERRAYGIRRKKNST